jgi:Cytochrome P460
MQSPTRLVQGSMKRISILWFAVVAVGNVIVSTTVALGGPGGGEDSSPIFGVTIPAGYRQWELIAPSHEEGFDELRGILGNALSMKAYREGPLPFPDGAMLAKLAWKRVPSSEYHGQGLEEIRLDGRLGFRPVR